MECFASEIHINQKYNFSKAKIHHGCMNLKKIISFLSILLLVLIATSTLQAQEKGPVMMKQELGYTLGGGVFAYPQCCECGNPTPAIFGVEYVN